MKLLLPTAAALAGQDGPPGGPSPADPWPEGFAYREEVISADEERALAERFALLPLTTSGFRGLLGWRRVVSCGWRYDGTGRGTRPSGGLPRLLLPLRDRAAEIADVPVQSLQQVLVTEVPPGAALGWRRDRSKIRGRDRRVVPRAVHPSAAPSRRARLGTPLPGGDATLGLSPPGPLTARLGAQHCAGRRAALRGDLRHFTVASATRRPLAAKGPGDGAPSVCISAEGARVGRAECGGAVTGPTKGGPHLDSRTLPTFIAAKFNSGHGKER